MLGSLSYECGRCECSSASPATVLLLSCEWAVCVETGTRLSVAVYLRRCRWSEPRSVLH